MSVPGDLVITSDVAGEFSRMVVSAFRNRPQETFSLALTGSHDARSCYERLATEAGAVIDWWKVDVYWADERCIPHDHDDSNYRMAREALLDRVGAAHATHLMRCAEGPDPYQLRLGDLDAMDLIHLGMGPDGHVAGLFPGSEAMTTDPGRLVAMSEDPSGASPYRHMTMTLGALARARQVVITVTGADRASAMASIASGVGLPAALVSAPFVTWLVDPDAAAGLS